MGVSESERNILLDMLVVFSMRTCNGFLRQLDDQVEHVFCFLVITLIVDRNLSSVSVRLSPGKLHIQKEYELLKSFGFLRNSHFASKEGYK